MFVRHSSDRSRVVASSPGRLGVASALCLSLLVATTTTTSAATRAVRAERPNDDAVSVVRVFRVDGVGHGASPAPLSIASDAPVILLPYGAHNERSHATGRDHVYATIVRDRAAADDDDDNAEVSLEKDDDGVARLIVRTRTTAPSDAAASAAFLAPSTYRSEWTVFDMLCDDDQNHAEEGDHRNQGSENASVGGVRRRPPAATAFVVIALSLLDGGVGRTLLLSAVVGALVSSSSSSFASAVANTTTVEILYDPCAFEITVAEAPAVRLAGPPTIVEIASERSRDHACATVYESTLEFPDVSAITEHDEGKPVVTYQNPDECYFLMEGRPFVDARGRPLSSDVVVRPERRWSVSTERRLRYDPVLARRWADRAVGEHASIASFAALAIALLTNGAPPVLVREALAAAEEERVHATTSFRLAASRSPNAVEPGPLPPSRLTFARNDLVALGRSAAEEGCVDETASALAAAVEAESYDDDDDLRAAAREIARDEAGHAASAWRTVAWVRDAVSDDARDEIARAWRTRAEETAARRFPDDGRARVLLQRATEDLLSTWSSEGRRRTIPRDERECDARVEEVRELETRGALAESVAEDVRRRVYCDVRVGETTDGRRDVDHDETNTM